MPRQRRFLDLGLVRRLQRIGDIAEADLKKNFDSEGAHFGAPWPLLTPATQEHRDFLAGAFGLPIGPDHPILVNFGEFRESVVEKHGMGHARYVGKYTIRISSNHKKGDMDEPFAGAVDEGVGNSPPRRIIHPDGATDEAFNLMERELIEHAEVVANLGNLP